MLRTFLVSDCCVGHRAMSASLVLLTVGRLQAGVPFARLAWPPAWPFARGPPPASGCAQGSCVSFSQALPPRDIKFRPLKQVGRQESLVCRMDSPTGGRLLESKLGLCRPVPYVALRIMEELFSQYG